MLNQLIDKEYKLAKKDLKCKLSLKKVESDSCCK
jgi:hypothetical protein